MKRNKLKLKLVFLPCEFVDIRCTVGKGRRSRHYSALVMQRHLSQWILHYINKFRN